MTGKQQARTLSLTLGSAVLLALSFPPFYLSPLIFVALIPLFLLQRDIPNWKAGFSRYFLAGFFFYLASMEWVRHVTYFGMVFLISMLAFYYGVFGVFVFWIWNRKKFLLSLIAIPSAWTVLEWVRVEMPTWACGWNLLAYAQADHYWISRLAGTFGAFGVSWLIVLVNLILFFFLEFLIYKDKRLLKYAGSGFALLLVFYAFSFWGGQQKTTQELGRLRISVIQGNVPQDDKWDPEKKWEIIKSYEALSRFGSEKKPDLIVWPEAAFPGFFNRDAGRFSVFSLVSELKTPLLFGSPHLDSDTKKFIAYNSAYWINPENVTVDRYDKIRLVPFGEYVPWAPLFRTVGLERLAYNLGVSDFYAGKEMKTFSVKKNIQFSTLLCFEDAFPSLARKAILKGADFLVVITNDAWFKKSGAPYQHLQVSQYRAIENGVPVIRSANTGVSGFVDARGRNIDRVRDPKGNDIFVGGGLMRDMEIEERTPTFYVTHGYLFPYFCLLVLLAVAVLFRLRRSA